MLQKKSIDPEKLKIISFVTTAILMLFVNAILTNTIIKKTNILTEQKYKESYKILTEGYEEAIKHKLDVQLTALNSFNSPELKHLESKEIQKLLQEKKYNNHSSFLQVFFLDKDGNSWCQNGNVYESSDRDFYKAILKNNETIFFSSPVVIRPNKSAAIVYATAIYDNNNSVKGALCAAIDIYHFKKVINEIKIGTEGQLIMLDKHGKFIVHSDDSWLNKQYFPAVPGFQSKSSISVVNKKEGMIETFSTKEVPIFLFFRQIENTNWTLGLSIPKEGADTLKYTQLIYQILIIAISCLVIISVLILELSLFSFFSRNQLLATTRDSLTNLFTRQKFEDEAQRLLNRNKTSKFMLIETDIRGFKFLNQNNGIEEANKIVCYFSNFLAKLTEQNNGVLGRGHADHFYIFYKIESVHKAMNNFKEFHTNLANEIKNYEIQFFPKYGIAFYIPDSESKFKKTSIKELIGHATFAKNTIKENILTSYAIYDSTLLKKSNDEHYIESHMEQALQDKEFFVMYQPKIDLTTDKVVGAEALVRWNSSKLGLMTPYKFIPLFEKNNFIKKLDFYVYEEVFKFLQRCIDKNDPIVPISMNMSRNHNKPDKFIHDFLAIFRKYTIPPKYIQIELLERTALDRNILTSITTMLHKEGFTVAMDDFGTGESSLNLLTKVPVDVLKFDKSFLDEAINEEKTGLDQDSAEVISSLISLGKNLKKKTIFEGVETRVQVDFLKSIDCDQVQGFFYSKPLTEEEYLKFLKEHI